MDRKKLDVIELNKINQEINKTMTVKIGNKYYVDVRVRVPESVLNSIFEQFGNWLANKEVQNLLGEQKVTSYLLCFVVKENTDIFSNNQYNDVELYHLFNALIENHIVDEIINYINKEDLIIIFDRLSNIMKTSKQIDKLINQMLKEKKKKDK